MHLQLWIYWYMIFQLIPTKLLIRQLHFPIRHYSGAKFETCMLNSIWITIYFLISFFFRSIDSFKRLSIQCFIQTYEDRSNYFCCWFQLAIIAVCIFCHVGVWGVFIIFINSFRGRDNYLKIWINVNLAFHNHMVYKMQGT